MVAISTARPTSGGQGTTCFDALLPMICSSQGALRMATIGTLSLKLRFVSKKLFAALSDHDAAQLPDRKRWYVTGYGCAL